jgi:hypothetical protein
MSQDDVFTIRKNKIFSLEGVRDLLPLVSKITKEANEELGLLEAQLESAETPRDRKQIENELNNRVLRWTEKIAKLGAEAKGFWLVDFDNGEGYYCWKYGEGDVLHFHDYESGFAGRMPIL